MKHYNRIKVGIVSMMILTTSITAEPPVTHDMGLILNRLNELETRVYALEKEYLSKRIQARRDRLDKGSMDAVPGLSLYDYQCSPGTNAQLLLNEPISVIVSYSNETAETYYLDLAAMDPNGQRKYPSGHRGMGWIRPGVGKAHLRVDFDNPASITSIRFNIISTNRQSRFTIDEIDTDITYNIPWPDVPENPLFNGLKEVSCHPNLAGIDDVKEALYALGLKKLGISYCSTTQPVILIGENVPVATAQEVLRICKEHLDVPIKDIQCEKAEPDSSLEDRIYVGVQRRPRYTEYPEDRLERLLAEKLSQDQFIQILNER